MISSRQTVATLLLALAVLPFSAATTFAADDDGVIVNDYSDTGADYSAPEKSAEKSSSEDNGEMSASDTGGEQGKSTASTDTGEDGKPYKVDCSGEGPCKANQAVVTGYETFGEYCARCHGENAQGTTFAPSLVQAFRTKNIGQGRFTAAVAGGLTVVDSTTGGYRVMPAWAENEAVMSQIQQLWAFVKARADGALKAGRPQPMDDKS